MSDTTFPPSVFIQEELDKRGWNPMDLAVRMGGTEKEIATNCLAVEMQLACDTDLDVFIDDEFARGMSVIETVCPEQGCGARTTAWASGRLIHKSEWDWQRACPQHEEKFKVIYNKWLSRREA